MAEALPCVPRAEEDNGDRMDKEEQCKRKMFFPNGCWVNSRKANTGDLKGRSNNVQHHRDSVDSSLCSDSDDNDSDSDSCCSNETNDKTGFASRLNGITDRLSSVSISTTQAEEDVSESDSDDEEDPLGLLARGLEKIKLTKARNAAAPYHGQDRKAHAQNRRGQDQNLSQHQNNFQFPFDNSQYFENNFEQSKESDKFPVEISTESTEEDVGALCDEWFTQNIVTPNAMPDLEKQHSSCDFESVPDQMAGNALMTISSNDLCGTGNFNYNQYSFPLDSPDSGVSVGRVTRLSVDSDISENGNSRNSLSPHSFFTDSSNSSSCYIRSISPCYSMSPCSMSPSSYDKSMSNFSGIGADNVTPDVLSVSPRNIVSPHNIVSSSSVTSSSALINSFGGFSGDGRLRFSPPEVNIVDSNAISTPHEDESQLFTANKLTGSGGTMVIKPSIEESRVSQVIKPLGSSNIPVFNNNPVTIGVIQQDTFSNCPAVSIPEPIDEISPVNKASSETSDPVNVSKTSRKSISDLMMGRDSLRDVLRHVRSNEILYRYEHVLMLTKIRQLEKIGVEQTNKVLYNYLIELSSVFGIGGSSVGEEEANKLKNVWKFQLVALIQCILQYLKKPEIFTMAHSHGTPQLFTPVQAAAIFNCQEPLVASCITDCVLVFTNENPDEKMLFSLQGKAKPSLMYMLYQIGETHVAVREQLKKIKMNDYVTPVFTLHIEKPHHDTGSAINEPVISEDTPIEFENSHGEHNILIQAMLNANLNGKFSE